MRNSIQTQADGIETKVGESSWRGSRVLLGLAVWSVRCKSESRIAYENSASAGASLVGEGSGEKSRRRRARVGGGTAVVAVSVAPDRRGGTTARGGSAIAASIVALASCWYGMVFVSGTQSLRR